MLFQAQRDPPLSFEPNPSHEEQLLQLLSVSDAQDMQYGAILARVKKRDSSFRIDFLIFSAAYRLQCYL
jgi:hypothetical protein